MNRVVAIQEIVSRHRDAAIVFSNGLTAREACHVAHRPGNFYLLHAMGESLAVGIGLRLARPDLEVVVVEGDGNAVMGLAMSTLLPIEGLHYYVLVNNVYETTNSEPPPPLTVTPPGMIKVEIERGTIGAPAPPEPVKIKRDFLSWLAGFLPASRS